MRPSSQACGSVESANPSSGCGSSAVDVARTRYGRHDDHQLGLFPLIIARAEQGAEDRQIHQAGESVDDLTRNCLQQAGRGNRAAGGQFDAGRILARQQAGGGHALDSTVLV